MIAALIGCTVGLTAGYFGGIVRALVGRIVDILFAFPVILLGIAIVAIMGPGVVQRRRCHRGRLAAELRPGLPGGDCPEKEREYVLAAHVVGAPRPGT